MLLQKAELSRFQCEVLIKAASGHLQSPEIKPIHVQTLATCTAVAPIQVRMAMHKGELCQLVSFPLIFLNATSH